MATFSSYARLDPVQFKFAKELSNRNWYNGSLSEALSKLLDHLGSTAPYSIHSVIHAAFAEVFFHENSIHEALQALPEGVPFHPSPTYVKDGYQRALQVLLMMLYSPNDLNYNHPTVELSRKRLTPALRAKSQLLELNLAQQKLW
ncbi:hypothetical protein FRC07_006187 [Ceratobasidium sp. 392]|nr:hypothetical protein FRC07_006187 [Ceratobasidium sp. 392]